MHRFWTRFILPLLLAAAPQRVLEIGAEFGWNTERLLALGRERGFFLDIIDPAPHEVFYRTLAGYDGAYAFHEARSLDAIGRIESADFVPLDGDHNWHTVYNELSQLFARAAAQGRKPPILLLHDLAWPYARRDMYYDARSIPELERQPHARRGIIPGEAGLSELGANAAFDNALQEGGPRNGVLTAVEDYLEASGIDVLFRRLPFLNGLGILIPAERLTPALQETVEGFFTPAALIETVEELETDINKLRVELAVTQLHLTRSADALARAQQVIAESEAPIAAPAPVRHADAQAPAAIVARSTDLTARARRAVRSVVGPIAAKLPPGLTRAGAPGPSGRS